ncbi:hypothetical protein PAXRUDRAFT_832125, partial [Paxillus rubicundulus Ve08.2h10]
QSRLGQPQTAHVHAYLAQKCVSNVAESKRSFKNMSPLRPRQREGKSCPCCPGQLSATQIQKQDCNAYKPGCSAHPHYH